MKINSYDQTALVLCKKPITQSFDACKELNFGKKDICINFDFCRIQSKSIEQIDYILSSTGNNNYLAACAGSGKTEVLGLKAAFTIVTTVQNRSGVTVLTFTNTASQIIQNRIYQICGVKGIKYPNYVGTFDSWLHKYIANPFGNLYTGYEGDCGDFSINIINDQLNSPFLNAFSTSFNFYNTGPIKANEYYYDLENKKYNFSSSNKTSDVIRNGHTLTADQNEALKNLKKKFWKAGYGTFQDIELISWLILEKIPRSTYLLSKRFPRIFIDECQDLSWVELQIIQKLLDNKTRVDFVGDLNQSIYSFREVDPKKINGFISHNKFTELSLLRNFRSIQPIVSLCSKLVPQGTIVGNTISDNRPACLCITYDKKNIKNVRSKFIEILNTYSIRKSKSAIVARNNNTVLKLRPGIPSDLDDRASIPVAMSLFNKKDSGINVLIDSLMCLGKYISHKYLGSLTNNKEQFYCPEKSYDAVKWRLFLNELLIVCLRDKNLSDFNQLWKNWAVKYREVFFGILSSTYKKYFLSIDSNKFKEYNYVTPKGFSTRTVQSIIGSVQAINHDGLLITNIHQVKGEEFDAIMVVSTTIKSGYWKEWIKDMNSESARFAYVACSRASKLLIWAIPDPVSEDEKNIIRNLGFTFAV